MLDHDVPLQATAPVPASAVPRLAAGGVASGQVVLDAAAYLLLCHVDGATTVTQLAGAAGLDLDVAAAAVAQLVSCGLAELEVAAGAALSVPDAPDDVAASVARVSAALMEAFAPEQPVADVVDFAAARRDALRREVEDHVESEAGRRAAAAEGDAARREAEARREVEALRKELDAARREAADHDVVREERDRLRADHDALRAELDARRTERDEARLCAERLRDERDAARAEAAQALADARAEAERLVADARTEAAWIVEEAGVRLHEARRTGAAPAPLPEPVPPPPAADDESSLLAALADLAAPTDSVAPPAARAPDDVPALDDPVLVEQEAAFRDAAEADARRAVAEALRAAQPEPACLGSSHQEAAAGGNDGDGDGDGNGDGDGDNDNEPDAGDGAFAPLPYVERDQADTAALLRELSSLGVEDAAAPIGPSAPSTPRPVAASVTTTPASAKKRKGIFGR